MPTRVRVKVKAKARGRGRPKANDLDDDHEMDLGRFRRGENRKRMKRIEKEKERKKKMEMKRKKKGLDKDKERKVEEDEEEERGPKRRGKRKREEEEEEEEEKMREGKNKKRKRNRKGRMEEEEKKVRFKFVGDDSDETEDILDVEKIKRKKTDPDSSSMEGEETGEESSEQDDQRAMFGKYPRQMDRNRDGIKGRKLFGFANKTTNVKEKSLMTKGTMNKMESVVRNNEKDDADAYFDAQHSQVQTSDTTLKMPKMSQERMEQLAKKGEKKNKKEMKELRKKYQEKFKDWRELLDEGFNLILYGTGSKRIVLNDFVAKVLSDERNCVVVNGFFPSTTIKQILNSMTEDLLKSDEKFPGPDEQVRFITGSLDKSGEEVFLVVHNIEGTNLRNDKSQNALSRLAAHPLIHLICSIDHINASLIWDHEKLCRLNFIWEDATTYLPYKEETKNENSFLVARSSALALSSLQRVFASLTPNAKAIFLLIVEHQMIPSDEDPEGSRGISFEDLYRQCRGKFLVNSDLNLRSQLVEYKDHKLITTKSHEGMESLVVPLDISTLKEFMEMQQE